MDLSMLKYTKSYAPRPYLKSQEYGIMEYVLLEILGKDLFELFVLCVMIVREIIRTWAIVDQDHSSSSDDLSNQIIVVGGRIILLLLRFEWLSRLHDKKHQ